VQKHAKAAIFITSATANKKYLCVKNSCRFLLAYLSNRWYRFSEGYLGSLPSISFHRKIRQKNEGKTICSGIRCGKTQYHDEMPMYLTLFMSCGVHRIYGHFSGIATAYCVS
jgi:hypothetical protein